MCNKTDLCYYDVNIYRVFIVLFYSALQILSIKCLLGHIPSKEHFGFA